MSPSSRSMLKKLCAPPGPGSSRPATSNRACTTEHPELSAAVVDLNLGDGNGTAVCRRLRHLGVPFVVHTGYPLVLITGEWPGVPIISKPACSDDIVAALAALLD